MIDCWILKIDPSQTNREKSILFNRTYGGESMDMAGSIIETSDKCLAVIGESYSMGGDLAKPGNKGPSDIWILKIDPGERNREKAVIFSATFGGSLNESCAGIAETSDGNFVIAGYSESSDGDLLSHGNKGQSDLWIFKVDPKAETPILFSRTYGGISTDSGFGVAAAAEGCLAIVGETASSDGDLGETGNQGGYDLWILKINELGSYDNSKAPEEPSEKSN